jgi:hypothetical protein
MRGPFEKVDTFTIALQIIVLQTGFYTILGASVFLAVTLLLDQPPHLENVFAADSGHVEALPVIFAHVLTAPVAAFLVGSVVSSSSQVLDQVATLSCIHLVLRIVIFGHFPRNLAFWAALAFDAFVMVVLGEFLARRAELMELRRSVGSLQQGDDEVAESGTAVGDGAGAVVVVGAGRPKR